MAITARTVHEGDGRCRSSSVLSRAAPVPIPGSLDTTAAEVGALGRRALPLRMDCYDRAQVLDTPAAVLAEWGRIDVLCNNAIYEGPAPSTASSTSTPTPSRARARNYVHQLLTPAGAAPHGGARLGAHRRHGLRFGPP